MENQSNNFNEVVIFLKTTFIIIASLIICVDSYAQNKKDIVVLEDSCLKNNEVPVLTQKDFIKENTSYIIKSNFDLKGKEIIIPNNSILEFNKGGVRNGVLNCNNTTLCGGIQLENTFLKGTITNNRIESDWFGLVEGRSADNYEKIINLIVSCENTKKDFHLNSGVYCTSRPIVFNVDYNVYMDGEICYTGEPNNSAIYIGSVEGRKGGKEFYISVSQGHYPSYTEDNGFITSSPHNVGVEISSVYSCVFHIKKIEEFIYGLVLIDNRNLGCGDNEFHIGQITNAYNGISVVSGSEKINKVCWINDNVFIGGRIWFYRNTHLKRTAIKFQRISAKGMSDNAFFMGMDLENHYNAIDFGGFATGCIVLGCRFENNGIAIVNEGNGGNLIIGGQKYLNTNASGPRTFFDYASELWKQKINKIILDIPQVNYAYDGINVSTTNLRISDRKSYGEVGEHALPSGINEYGELKINHTRFFVDIDVSKLRMLKIETVGEWRAMMDFYDSEGNRCKPFENYRDHLYFYDHNIDGWYNNDGVFAVAYKMTSYNPLCLYIKDNDIAQIRLYVFGDSTLGECWIKSLRISADEFAEVDNVNKSFHLSSMPIKTRGVDVIPNGTNYNIKPGTVYFDSSNRPIFWNGSEWVDAMGNHSAPKH